MAGPVVVITGASSGIGRATALRFARSGASLVLASRQHAALAELVRECERAGAIALSVPTDVTEEEAVARLATAAADRFGVIDVWVNNAAVGAFGRFDDLPSNVFRRVIDTDLFGFVYGARAALGRFREQGRGILINVGSVAGAVTQPYTSPYEMSKHAVRALGATLRQELLLEGARAIHVCTVLPASIDTPFFEHAGNYTRRGISPMPPVYPVERVAETIFRLSRRPRREAFVGSSGWLLSTLYKLAPGRAERVMARQTERSHLTDEVVPETNGNLFASMPPVGQESGGWLEGRRRRVLRIAAGALAVAVPAAAGGVWMRRRRRPPGVWRRVRDAVSAPLG